MFFKVDGVEFTLREFSEKKDTIEKMSFFPMISAYAI